MTPDNATRILVSCADCTMSETPAWMDGFVTKLRTHIDIEGPIGINIWRDGPTQHVAIYPALVKELDGDVGFASIGYSIDGVAELVSEFPAHACTDDGILFEFEHETTPVVLHLMLYPPDGAEPMYQETRNGVTPITASKGPTLLN